MHLNGNSPIFKIVFKSWIIIMGFVGVVPYLAFGVHDLSVFSDQEFIRLASKNRHDSKLAMARREGDEPEILEGRRFMLLAYAHTSFLDGLLASFPRGHQTVLDECATDPLYFMNLLQAVTRKHVSSDSWESFEFGCNGYWNFAMFEAKSETANVSFPEAGTFLWKVNYFNRHVYARDVAQSRFLEKLLNIPVLQIPIKDKKKKPDQYHAAQKLTYLVPLLWGDVEMLTVEAGGLPSTSYGKVKDLVGRDYQRLPKNAYFRRAYRAAFGNLGEKKSCEANTDVSSTRAYFLEQLNFAEKEGPRTELPFVHMLKAQYLIGRIPLSKWEPPTPREVEEGFRLLERLKTPDSLVDYVAWITHVDFVLWGDLPIEEKKQKAQGLIESGLKTGITEPFNRRLAEIHLGLFGGDPQVDLALRFLAGAEAPELLFRVYTGRFGLHYLDNEKAEEIIVGAIDMTIFKIYKAIFFLRNKKYQEALCLLKKIPTMAFSKYWMGRLYLDPTSGFTNVKKGIPLMEQVASIKYRDAQARLLKFYARTLPDLKDGLTVNAITEIRKTNSWSQEQVITILRQHKLAAESALPSEPPQEEEQVACSAEQEFESDLTSEEAEEEAGSVLERVNSIDEQEPVIMLSELIEALMEKLHYQWTWRQLTPHLEALGGIFTSPTSILFPDVPGVFNFHLPHAGSDRFFLSKGYYRALKNMIEARYEVLLQEARAQRQRLQGDV